MTAGKTVDIQQVYSLSPEISILFAKSNWADISQSDFKKTRAKAFLATRKTPMGGQVTFKALQVHSL